MRNLPEGIRGIGNDMRGAALGCLQVAGALRSFPRFGDMILMTPATVEDVADKMEQIARILDDMAISFERAEEGLQ